MKLIKYSKLSEKKRETLSTIIGFKGNIPTTYVKSVNLVGWEIMQSKDKNKLSKNQNIETVSIEESLQDVISFFKQNRLVAYCPFDKHKSQELEKFLIQKNKNRRKYPRKDVILNGNFFNKRTKHSGGFRTQDISLRGIKFNSKSKHDIVVGDNLMVFYILKNNQKSKIKREIKTRYINNKQIGGEIINPPPLDPDLGFYLME